MMQSTATSAMKPPTVPISSRAIWPSDLPSRRIENSRMTKSCTPPPSTAPMMIQSVPGQIAELRRQHRPTSGPGPGDGGEVVAEDHPFVGRLEIVPVVQAFGRRGAQVVECHDLGGDEFAVETEAHGIGADRRDHQPHAVDVLAAMQGDRCQSQRAQKGDRQPDQNAKYFRHEGFGLRSYCGESIGKVQSAREIRTRHPR